MYWLLYSSTYSNWLVSDTPYVRSVSPDGNYVVEARSRFSLLNLLPVMPGSGGAKDSPGFVYLQDREGKILEREPVDWLQSVERIEWHPDMVSVAFLVDWDLPVVMQSSVARVDTNEPNSLDTTVTKSGNWTYEQLIENTRVY